MHLFVLLLFVGIFSKDPLADILSPYHLAGPLVLTVLTVPKLLLAVLYWLVCRLTLAGLGRPDPHPRLRRLDRMSALYRLGALSLYLLDLALAMPARIEARIGDWILVDELLIMAPTLAMLVWSWWAFYPIDRRLRDAQLLSRIDLGLPIHPVWTRGQYLLTQLRFQVAPAFVPMMALLALSQGIEKYGPGPDRSGRLRFDPGFWMQASGACCIFLFAPVVIRHMWDTIPLPPGDLRDRLTAMCRQYRVGVRELLLWRTYGGMVNAAVMGLVRPLRYILLSDALLELVTQSQVEAVMAHELAHVRRRHMIWMLASTAALIMGMLMVSVEVWHHARIFLIRHAPPSWEPLPDLLIRNPQLVSHAAIVSSVAAWIVAFGWVSRRFERQADTFAVQHLAATRTPDGFEGPVVQIDSQSTRTMIEALEQVARLNHMSPQRRSWRHGSIIWRQQYLRGLVGQPIDRLPIDRHIGWIKRLTALALIITVVIMMINWWRSDRRTEDAPISPSLSVRGLKSSSFSKVCHPSIKDDDGDDSHCLTKRRALITFPQNCLRKRRSFSKNQRMSWMPYLRMANRSIPRPKAKPVHFSGS